MRLHERDLAQKHWLDGYKAGREVTDQMTYRAAAELHREMCGCAASEDTGEGVPWCDSIWPVRARRIVVAALRQIQPSEGDQ